MTGWDDDSGNGHDLTPFGNDAPTVTTNAINGKPVVTCDSFEDRMKADMGTVLQDDHTYYIVVKKTGSVQQSYAPLLAYSDSAGTAKKRLSTRAYVKKMAL